MSDLPAVGDAMPDIEMGTPDGSTVKPSDFQGGKLVVFFYPRDNTPGCTTEERSLASWRALARRNSSDMVTQTWW